MAHNVKLFDAVYSISVYSGARPSDAAMETDLTETLTNSDGTCTFSSMPDIARVLEKKFELQKFTVNAVEDGICLDWGGLHVHVYVGSDGEPAPQKTIEALVRRLVERGANLI